MAVHIKTRQTNDRSNLVMGIDPSTNTGLVIVDVLPENAWIKHSEVLKFPKQPGFKRLASIYTKMQDLYNQYLPQLIVIEGYAHGSKFNNTTQTEIGAAFRTALGMLDAVAIQVAPTTLKKYVTGKGNANKEQVVLHAFKRWGFEGTNDQCDALGLAMFGAQLLHRDSVQSTKVQLVAVDSWIKENQGVLESMHLSAEKPDKR